jgi:hypothetical protein
MSTVLLMPTDTRLLIETAIELRRNTKKLVREVKASTRELNHSRQLSQQLRHAYIRKSGERTAAQSIIVTTI